MFWTSVYSKGEGTNNAITYSIIVSDKYQENRGWNGEVVGLKIVRLHSSVD